MTNATKKIIFTIGADPELFLRAVRSGKFVSSIDKIGGTKELPMPIGEGCAVQEDNVAVEFNIPVCHTPDEFVTGLNYNLNYLKKVAMDMGLELCIVPSANFDKDELADPRAMEFGCEPDFNAWTRKVNPRPRTEDKSLRSAGGHIHVGFDKDTYDFEQVVRAMDIFVGCEMLEFDTDTKRRLLYGKAGAFRPKDYGIEYRTASNAWIQTEDRMKWAYHQTQKALEFVSKGKIIPADGVGVMIQSCINNSDLTLLNEVREYAAA